MLKFFTAHWKLCIFSFLAVFLIVYSFGQQIISNAVQVLHWQDLFSASLATAPNQSLDALTLETSLDVPPSQDAPTQQLPDQNPVTEPSVDAQLVVADNKQDQIDDLLEKIDLLQRQLADALVAQSEIQQKEQDQNKVSVVEEEVETIKKSVSENLPQQNDIKVIVYSGGGSSRTVYPKILISEVQIAGTEDAKQEFVELYNPGDQELDLTSWYIQRKTKTGSDYSTFAPHALFSGKKITSNGYFLIAREGYFDGLADVFVENPLTQDNSLILKNPNGEISDKVGWGQAQDYELLSTVNPAPGQSIGRKIVAEQPYDTDINERDFELNTPTPKAKNTIYVAPEVLPLEDTDAPEITFNIEALQDSLSFAVSFTIIDPLETVSPSGVAGYIFRWKEENNDWHENDYKNVDGGPASFEGLEDFIGSDEKNYYFQVKAKDLEGNESAWQPEPPAETKISIFKKILINEIQIDSLAGTGGTNDDWVELYNPNDVSVSLAGWSIQKHSSSSPCSIGKSFSHKSFQDDASVPAQGFFLIVSTKANDELKLVADMTISWILSDNNTIYLVKSKDDIASGEDPNIVDKVGFGANACFPENNSAPAPPEEKSIERKELGLDTDNNADDFRISSAVSPKATFAEVIAPAPVPSVPAEPPPEELPAESLPEPIDNSPADSSADQPTFP